MFQIFVITGTDFSADVFQLFVADTLLAVHCHFPKSVIISIELCLHTGISLDKTISIVILCLWTEVRIVVQRLLMKIKQKSLLKQLGKENGRMKVD